MKTTYIITFFLQICLVKEVFQFSIVSRVVTRDIQKLVTTSYMTYEKDNVLQNKNAPRKERYIHPQVHITLLI